MMKNMKNKNLPIMKTLYKFRNLSFKGFLMMTMLLISSVAFSQKGVSIGKNGEMPNSSAILEISSKDKGLLILG